MIVNGIYEGRLYFINKKSITNFNKEIDSGVYGIFMLDSCPSKDSTLYIGSAFNLKRRIARHFNDLKRDKHHCNHLQNVYNKYGKDYFVVFVLEFTNKQLCVLREQNWIDYFNDTFPNHKVLFNENNKASNPPIQTSETYNKSLTEKGREALIKTNRRHNSDYYRLFDPDGNIIIISGSMSQFCKKYSLRKRHVQSVLSGERKHHKGWQNVNNQFQKINEKKYYNYER